jgi:pimeloyl-ACP methyl ester carboxylesterase
VCVNAVQQTMAAWRPFISRFGADRRYRLAMFDFPNQGRARVLTGAVEVQLMEQVAILDAVVDRVSPYAPVAITGGSWGAVIAATYAATHSSRVASLILGSFQTKSNLRLRAITERGMALIDRADLDGLGRLFVEGFGGRMPESRQHRLLQQFRRLGPEQLRQILVQGRVLLECGDIFAFADLAAIRARTLIVNGAADPIVDVEDALEAAARIADSEVRLLPGVGHFLHVEQPDIMDIYCDFLSRAT